jgi:TrpR family trp operon transcriptional repressor
MKPLASEPVHPDLPADLLRLLADLREPEALRLVLADLLTPAETEALTERWEIAKLLQAGHSQRGVSAGLGVSITTVSRGARQLKYGHGGFQLAFRALGLQAGA